MDRVRSESISIRTYHTIFGQIGWPSYEGVALIMSREKERTLIKWKPSGPRLLKARFNSKYTKYTKLTVIVCYARTEDAGEADKDAGFL